MSEQIKRQQNREVPFPAREVYQLGAFERYLLKFIEEGATNPFNCYQLPEIIHLGGFETYFNYLNDLVQTDPNHRERGAVIHAGIQHGSLRLIIPPNPYLGTRHETGFIFTRKPPVVLPVVNVHTHPTNEPFSVRDISLLPFTPIAQVLTTPYKNYLLARTSQTGFGFGWQFDEEPLEEQLRQKKTDFESKIRRVKKLLGSTEILWSIIVDGAMNGQHIQDFIDYGARLEFIKEITKKLKLGFYWSAKDGVYHLANGRKDENAPMDYQMALRVAADKIEKLYHLRVNFEKETVSIIP